VNQELTTLRWITNLTAVAIAGCAFAFAAYAQTPGAKSNPAPKRDLTGFWTPVRVGDGIGANGAMSMRADGSHEPPYTAAGRAAFLKNKPSNGTTEVGPGEENDPGHSCDPLGFPRNDLFELRGEQFVQTPSQLMILYQYDRLWRSIWTDGRALPADPDPRWYGYSVGKWTDDYTFVAETSGIDERSWLDNSGRPHSDEIKVQEIFHRVDRDNMEISVIVDDPKFYSKPWVAIDKIQMKALPANTDMLEMMCVPSELAEYNKRHANLGNSKSK
jgi:hypothetical protein